MQKKLPIFFVLVTVVIDAMGIGLIMPVTPDLLRQVGATDLADAAVWGGILVAIFASMNFLCGPTLGNLSDRYGRRPIIIIALVFMAFHYFLMATATMMIVLIIGRIIGGITAATQATAAAYISDLSKPEEKAANFGLIGAAFGIGFVLGPLLGGLLADFGTRAPFWAAGTLAFGCAVFGYFVLPETVDDTIRRDFSWRRANPLGAFKSISALPGLRRLLGITFIYAIAFYVYPAVWSYFAAERFDWNPRMIGISLAVFGVSIAIMQGWLIRPLLRRIGERNAVILGLVVDVLAFVLLGFVQQGWIALMLTPLTAIGSIAGPAMQGMMARRAGDDQQGELQGTIAAINAVATIIAPLVMTQTFWFFTAERTPFYLPGAPFLVAAVLAIICIVSFLGTPRASPVSKPVDQTGPSAHPY